MTRITVLALLGLVVLPNSNVHAQTADIGADFVSRYVWRGSRLRRILQCPAGTDLYLRRTRGGKLGLVFSGIRRRLFE